MIVEIEVRVGMWVAGNRYRSLRAAQAAMEAAGIAPAQWRVKNA